VNVQRLKTYKANLVVFPRRMKKPKSGDASTEELSKVTQLSGAVQPIKKASPRCKAQKVDAKAKSAYVTMRIARSDAKYIGVREKRAKEKAEKAEQEKAKQAK
jgi:large subunit ribosomal protein L13e